MIGGIYWETRIAGRYRRAPQNGVYPDFAANAALPANVGLAAELSKEGGGLCISAFWATACWPSD